MVVLGCQYNVGGTMDAATFLTALCENKLPCTKSKNMRPQKPPTLPEAENPIQAGVSGPEQGGMVVPQESTSTAAPSTSAPTAAPPEEVSTASVATVPPSTSAAPPGVYCGDEMSFYPCLCARKAKYRGLLWKPRMNSRRTRAITWKDYNFIFPLSVVRVIDTPASTDAANGKAEAPWETRQCSLVTLAVRMSRRKLLETPGY
ncbi:hypothetical protein HPB49_023556 [Dermacentor silvarum]|uniref:Uncharacterized protein n=1 Tax=Dermacentor silvarum TaxID=543639 RepID=A0ACB8CC05_DERSI|nr:hypothetical protein HPB49_023556 [Dermacentor silvarum]